MRDPLYFIFEKHLMTALVEDETLDEFLASVVIAYMGHLRTNGTVIPPSHAALLETDIREEVLEMYRKKTYGHYNLAAYRRAHGVESEPSVFPSTSADAQNEKARRGGRAS
jgi:hypothetical protein